MNKEKTAKHRNLAVFCRCNNRIHFGPSGESRTLLH
nr:MAG TPA: hypothetical protein [Caudoviricetes sp.]